MSSFSAADTIETPMQFLRISLEDEVIVECRDNRILTGILHSYDEHMNILLGDAVETIITFDDVDGKKVKKETQKKFPALFVRGDTVLALSNAFN